MKRQTYVGLLHWLLTLSTGISSSMSGQGPGAESNALGLMARIGRVIWFDSSILTTSSATLFILLSSRLILFFCLTMIRAEIINL